MKLSALSLWPERSSRGLFGAPDQALLIEALERAGIEVRLLSRFWVPKGRLGTLALPAAFVLNNLKAIFSGKKLAGADCVLALTGHLVPAAQRIAQRLGVPLIVKQHGLREFLAGGLLNKLRCYDSWFALRARGFKIFVEDGSGASRLKPDLLVLPARRGKVFRVPRERLACFAGRLNKVKGAHKLLGLAEELGGRLLVLGDGPLREALERAGAKVMGPVPWERVPEVLAGCRVVLGLNPYGNLTLPVIEGAEQGAVPVVLDRGTTREFLEGGAILVRDEREAAEWARRLLEDDGLWAELSEAAREKAAEFPTWEERLRVEVEFLRKVCSGGF